MRVATGQGSNARTGAENEKIPNRIRVAGEREKFAFDTRENSANCICRSRDPEVLLSREQTRFQTKTKLHYRVAGTRSIGAVFSGICHDLLEFARISVNLLANEAAEEASGREVARLRVSPTLDSRIREAPMVYEAERKRGIRRTIETGLFQYRHS